MPNRKNLRAVIMLSILGPLFAGFGACSREAPAPVQSSSDVPHAALDSRVANAENLERPHSPVLGPAQAPVTIVEFFDPACEACRAFYPLVKDLLDRHPQDVRLVLRYAPFHANSDKIVRLLEAAKRQDKYWEVLDALLTTQPLWADHSRPDITIAYRSAEQAGLDLKRALADADAPGMEAILKQEMEDVVAFKIESTPTFFVNGEALSRAGPEALSALVEKKVAERVKAPAN